MRDRHRVDCQMIVDDAIQNQVEETPPDPFDADLVDLVTFLIIVIAAELLEIDHREKRETDVRQHEKIAERLRQSWRCRLVLRSYR